MGASARIKAGAANALVVIVFLEATRSQGNKQWFQLKALLMEQ